MNPMCSNEELESEIHFFLWSFAGEPGTRIAYWEFVDKLTEMDIPFHIASQAVMSMVEHPHYFDIDETDGLFFIKRSDSAIGD